MQGHLNILSKARAMEFQKLLIQSLAGQVLLVDTKDKTISVLAIAMGDNKKKSLA